MRRPCVLIVVDRGDRLGPQLGSKSETNVGLFREWIARLDIVDFELVHSRDRKKIKEWPGPVLALGHHAKAQAMQAGRPCEMIPHPFKHSSAMPVIDAVLNGVRERLWAEKPKPKINIVK